MKVLFTTSPYPLSWAIREITGEDVSHCALQYNDLVVHATIGGVRLDHISVFKEHNSIIYEVEVPFGSSDLLLEILYKYLGKGYDYGALLFLGLRFLAKKFRLLPIPKINLWQTTGMYLCTEFVLTALLVQGISQAESGLITPYQLYLRLKDYTNV